MKQCACRCWNRAYGRLQEKCAGQFLGWAYWRHLVRVGAGQRQSWAYWLGGAPGGETARLPSVSLDLLAADTMRWPVFPELGLRASLAEERRWPAGRLDLLARRMQERRWPSTMGLLASGSVAVARCRWRRARVAKAKDGAHPARVGHSAVLLDIRFAAESLDPAFTPRRVALEAEGPDSQRLLKEAHFAVSEAECFPRH